MSAPELILHMAPDPGAGGEYTVRVTLAKAIPDAEHLRAIRDAVRRVHRCTYHATELLNLYVRERIEHHEATGLDDIFAPNWLVKAFQTVSYGKRVAQVESRIQSVFDTHMKGTFECIDREGLTQAQMYECINLAAVGRTNVWMHFRKRVLKHVRTQFALGNPEYDALGKEERCARKLALMQVADDLCRRPDDPLRSPGEYHGWIAAQRTRLGIDAAVGDWNDKPLLYHLKANPQRFLKAMYLMSVDQHAAGRMAFALFPLRRSHVPSHMRVDQAVLDQLLKLGCRSANRIAAKSQPQEAKEQTGRAPKRKRNDPDLLAEKGSVFARVLDLRGAGVHRRHHFAFAFTTDGVSLHLNMEKPGKHNTSRAKASKPAAKMDTMPTRGIYAIDQLKHASRLADMHVVGIDPGKRELIVAVDRDDPKMKPVVRYTLDQRRRDLRVRQYAAEVAHSRPYPVMAAHEDLSLFNSKAPSLAEFARYATMRRKLLRECPDICEFYEDIAHRERRRKTAIKAQKSEASLVNRLKGMHDEAHDKRALVLAYGAWGLQAGKPNAPANRGTPPAIGVGLMKKLALHFVVAPTPEHYTSKTCVKCLGPCGPHPTLRTKDNKEIRGLRVCQHEGCSLPQNRDKTGASNIGLQFERLMDGKPPIRTMTEEEIEFHRISVCLECHDS